MKIQKIKRKVKKVKLAKHNIFEFVYDFSDFQDKEKERCKKLGIPFDPFEQYGTQERWDEFYKNHVNK